MEKNAYLPLKYSQSMNMETLSAVLKKAAWAFAGRKKGKQHEQYDITCREIEDADADDILAMTGNPGFFTAGYRGVLRNLHDVLVRGTSFNRKYFESTDYEEEWRDLLVMSALCDKWSRNRQVYEFDADFARELANTRELSLYPEILRRLPYDTFYLEHGGIEEFSPVNGVFVNIRVFNDGGMEVLLYRTVGNMYLSGRYRFDRKDAETDGDYIYYRFDKSLIRHRPDLGKFPVQGGNAPVKFDNSGFGDMAAFYFQAVCYLCSKKPDISRNIVTRKIYRPSSGTPADGGSLSQIRKWDVGLYYGNVIRMQREENGGTREERPGGAKTSASNGNRKPVRPHCRCAHWHHYWTGKGRTKLEIRWVQPSFVSADTDGMPVRINRVEK